MTFSIRAVEEEDAKSIIDVLNPIIGEGAYTVMDKQVTLQDQIDFIRNFPERGLYNVAVCNESGRVLGVQDVVPIAREPAFAHVGAVSTFVSLGSHGRGIGSGLSLATFRAARERGFLKISATIRADNPRALSFYLRQGFRVIGTVQNHALVGGKYIDEILAEKFID